MVSRFQNIARRPVALRTTFGVAIGVVTMRITTCAIAAHDKETKQAEARHGVARLAAGIAACATAEGVATHAGPRHRLPPSSRPVPATLNAVRGKTYASTPADWSDRAFQCARFSMPQPQFFQYQWKLLEHDWMDDLLEQTEHGIACATADLDGDGVPDATFQAEVVCTSKATCTSGAVRQDNLQSR
jgi:hypothetical protein